ncbi:TA system VapC family ribonuclease toxin [Nitrospira sp. BLG_1]|uniref:TA system VapC family ribonuclease toxin n=1 Tax=Nitrospira sp. BLG_1 TaxID=3395883 RepID=UPI0039BC54FA
MILIDANLLLYAKVKDYPQHQHARHWLEDQLNSGKRVGLPWPTLLAFIRIGTNPKAFNRPLSVRGAWSQVKEWLAIPAVWIPLPTDRHAAILGELLHDTEALANLVPDAHLAALALEHGLILQSTDGDFARFSQLQWQNPLRKKHLD